MNQKPDFQKVREVLSEAQIVLVVFPKSLTIDKVAASLSLYLSLKKANRPVTIVSSQPMTVEFSRLVGADKITDKIGGRNLTISFDYVKDSIEKVSYNVDGGKFNLVIQPKPGFSPIDTKTVNYSYSGGDGSLIFIIGAQRLEDLGSLFESERNLFNEKRTINIDCSGENNQYGKINIVNPQASSCSEIIDEMIRELNLPFDQDMASNLLAGLRSSTNNLQSQSVSADTFEAAAHCLRAGAKMAKQEKPLKEESGKLPSSSDWLSPKVYQGKTRV
jgi:hypothetical protein